MLKSFASGRPIIHLWIAMGFARIRHPFCTIPPNVAGNQYRPTVGMPECRYEHTSGWSLVAGNRVTSAEGTLMGHTAETPSSGVTKTGALRAYILHCASAAIGLVYLLAFLATRGAVNMMFALFALPLLIVASAAVLSSIRVRSRTLIMLGCVTLAMTSAVLLAGTVQLGYIAALFMVPVSVACTIIALVRASRE
jgi:hypothetical protein